MSTAKWAAIDGTERVASPPCDVEWLCVVADCLGPAVTRATVDVPDVTYNFCGAHGTRQGLADHMTSLALTPPDTHAPLEEADATIDPLVISVPKVVEVAQAEPG